MSRKPLLLFWAVVATSLFCGCRTWHQAPDEALIREPGHRTYEEPVSVEKEARLHWEFALLSEVAYLEVEETDAQQRSDNNGNTKSAITLNDGITPCPSPAFTLDRAEWGRWKEFPNPRLAEAMKESNLRAEVWEKKGSSMVVVAFGGTVFNSGKDWKSNLRWFLPTHNDEYTLLVKELVPAFTTEFRRRASSNEAEIPKIYATGHSLGGGLAQEFAYALPEKPDGLRVEAVFAFDPSPVTGYYSVDKQVRDRGKENLVIERVFERGEILAALRSLLALLYPPSASEPTIRTVRYNFDGPTNPVSAHSMPRLACRLAESANAPMK